MLRLYGYNKENPPPPFVNLIPAEYENELRLHDKIRMVLVGLGFSEVYNSSFTGKKALTSLEIENPIAEEKKYLRTELEESLRTNAGYNLKFGDTTKVFEIGKEFFKKGKKHEEKWHLGIALGVKENDPKLLLELKGALEELLRKIGLTEIFMVKEGKKVRIESGEDNLGYASAEPIGKNGYATIAELEDR